MSKILKSYLEFLYGEENEVKVLMNVAGAIIVKEENDRKLILIIRRSNTDTWGLKYEYPRGKCDQGKHEKIIHCLKREAKEETNLDIIPIKYLGKFEYLADKGTRKSVQYNFLCKMKDQNQKVILSKEHDDYKWISTAGEAQLYLSQECLRTVLKVFDSDEKYIVYPELTTEKIPE
jgi:8-oxo-dGTP pyrophosphatase MutT (NUDIX family)